MTETEWLTCEDPVPMLTLLGSCTAERKLRLFTVACARLVWDHFTDNVMREAVVAAERCADGVPWESELKQYCNAMYRLPVERSRATGMNGFTLWTADECAAYFTALKTTAAGCGLVKFSSGIAWPLAVTLTGARQPALIRDIFGNPFRPVTFRSTWRSPAVVELASRMYESRDFGAMPILGDALQDAGCDSTDVLEHCRGPGPHVRGCWAVDLVLDRI
ncbi:hypothetical protein VT84_21100 [Gemmata sp. SH-PL17]|uniref:hypothetical protein n=1 Tax=Gemmata sp. SH-PL17 TaxID=1630693 RepID=UPI00078B68F6|nr:hypothetical protein [Gemmata sp. SH-PL17]AMV26912.1 hypothetical protein VT84_21100 [Gemmata sp. SH-PL17]